MSRNEISLDQIERRLGSHGAAQPHGAGYDTPFSVAASEGAQDNSILNSGFIATAFAAFMLAGSGSFFFMGDALPDLERFTGDPGIASIVDPVCSGSWRSAGDNSDSLTCYLTTQPDRFCDANERKKLRALIVNFRSELIAYNAAQDARIEKLRVKLLESAANGSVGMFDMLGDEKGEGKKTLKAAGKQMKRMKRSMRKKASVARQTFEAEVARLATQRLRHERREEELAAQVATLIESGYLQATDIGWFSDEILRKGYSDAKFVPDRPCSP